MTTLKNIAVALATTVIFSNITNAQQAIPTSYSVNYEEPLAVKYIGSDGDYLTFQVSVQSATPARHCLKFPTRTRENCILLMLLTT